MKNLALLSLLAHILALHALPEESFLLPALSSEDDDMYLYVDTRSASEPKQSETRRRSTLDKNFARFGRGDLAPLVEYDSPDTVDNFADNFARPTRSQDKNDHFIRFGRGKNNFVRFGRDQQYRLVRPSSSGSQQNFVRFGRGRNKRETDAMEKRAGGSNFVRFGRNQNFVRFGRDPEELEHLIPTTTSTKPVAEKTMQNEYMVRLLLELLRKLRADSLSQM